MARAAAWWTAVRIAILLAALASVSLLGWLASSETALVWAVARLEASSGGRLRIDTAQGTLLGPIAAAKLTYTDQDLSLVVERPTVALQWRSLLHGTVALRALTASSLELHFGTSAGPAPRLPDSLAPPVRVAISRFEFGRLVLHRDGATTVFTQLAGSYAGGRRQHRLVLERAGTVWGEIGAELNLGAAAPFEIAAVLRFTGSNLAPPASAEAKIDGNLQHVRTTLNASLGAALADGEAELAPFAPDWLTRARLQLRGVDFAAHVEGAPRTDAQVVLQLAGGAQGTLRGQLTLENADAGALSAGRMPLVFLETDVAVRGTVVTLEQLRANLGAAGRLRGAGVIDGLRSRFALTAEALDLHAVHAKIRPTALRGSLRAEVGAETQQLTLDLRDDELTLAGRLALEGQSVTLEQLRATLRGGELRGSARIALDGERRFAASVQARGFDPASFGDWPRARLNGSVEAQGALAPSWRAEVRAQLENSRFGNAPLTARATFGVAPQAVRGLDAEIQLGTNHARVRGNFGGSGDALEIGFDARNLSQLDRRIGGRIAGTATLSGTLERLGGTLKAQGGVLAFEKRYRVRELIARGTLSADMERRIALELDMHGVQLQQREIASARVAISGRAAAHEFVVQAKGVDLDARLVIAGGWSDARGWGGSVKEFVNRGAYRAELASPAPLEVAPGRVAFGPATLRVLGGELVLRTLRFENGRLESAGHMRALPAPGLLALAGLQVQPGSDLSLKGEWSIGASPRLNGALRIEREAGDLLLSVEPRVAAGLAALALDGRIADDVIELEGVLRMARWGNARLQGRIVPAPGGAPGVIDGAARLEGTLVAGLPTLSLAQELIGGAAAIDGRVEAALKFAGTLAAPVITGNASADGVRVNMPQHALALRDGKARLKLDERALTVESLSIRGPEGELRASGSMPLGDGAASLEWQMERLRVFNRPDRQLVVSGAGKAALTQQRLSLSGELKADFGVFELPDRQAERLGDDVVVLGRATRGVEPARRAPAFDLDLVLDTGERFRIRAQGLETGLRGRLRLRSRADGEIVAQGSIETRGGSYRAFGQQLVIERGRLQFDGPVSNPGLDVYALRKNQTVEAGVQVSGTMRSPVVRLVSNPPVPDQEKLAWLVLGHGAASAAGAETALLQAAAGALAGAGQDGPAGQTFARRFGLDEVGLRSGAGGPLVSFGKRLSERIYVEYEQGLTAAAALVRLKFALTRSLNLNADAGAQGGGVGIGYGFSYD